jgi:cytochrome P450
MQPEQQGTPAPADDWHPTRVEDHPAEYRRLRAECPVAFTSDYDGFWGLMRYDDVQKGARDWRTYASGQPFVEFPAFAKAIPIQENPPQHTYWRRFLNPYFAPDRVAALVPDIEEIVARCLDPMVERGEGDIIDELGRIVPQQVLAKVLRLPDDAWVTMADSLARADAVRHDTAKLAEVNKDLWHPTVEALIADRRAHPQDPATDIMSGALQLQPEGRPITHEELVAIGVQVFAAGADTTTAAIGSLVAYLGRDQEAQQRVREDRALVPAALEESLRLAPPIQHLGRTSTCPVSVRGRDIPAEVKVGLNLFSANRDEDKFERADEFVLDRTANPHLTFGHGPHVCVGAPVARQELAVLLTQLLDKTIWFELDGEPVSNGRPLRAGWTSVRVRFAR